MVLTNFCDVVGVALAVLVFDDGVVCILVVGVIVTNHLVDCDNKLVNL